MYGLHRWISGNESNTGVTPANTGVTGETGSIPGLGRSPGGRKGNPLQYSCLENSMDQGVWEAIVLGFTKSQIQLSTKVKHDLQLQAVAPSPTTDSNKKETWCIKTKGHPTYSQDFPVVLRGK